MPHMRSLRFVAMATDEGHNSTIMSNQPAKAEVTQQQQQQQQQQHQQQQQQQYRQCNASQRVSKLTKHSKYFVERKEIQHKQHPKQETFCSKSIKYALLEVQCFCYCKDGFGGDLGCRSPNLEYPGAPLGPGSCHG
eukprot:3112423-Amphidinium_carterae.1